MPIGILFIFYGISFSKSPERANCYSPVRSAGDRNHEFQLALKGQASIAYSGRNCNWRALSGLIPLYKYLTQGFTLSYNSSPLQGCNGKHTQRRHTHSHTIWIGYGQSLIILITFVYLPSTQKQTSIKSSCCPSCLADSNGFCRQADFAWLMHVLPPVQAACLYIKTTRTADKNGNEYFPFLIWFTLSWNYKDSV